MSEVDVYVDTRAGSTVWGRFPAAEGSRVAGAIESMRVAGTGTYVLSIRGVPECAVDARDIVRVRTGAVR